MCVAEQKSDLKAEVGNSAAAGTLAYFCVPHACTLVCVWKINEQYVLVIYCVCHRRVYARARTLADWHEF